MHLALQQGEGYNREREGVYSNASLNRGPPDTPDACRAADLSEINWVNEQFRIPILSSSPLETQDSANCWGGPSVLRFCLASATGREPPAL